jgi:transcriptional regulator with XRE-family HTH domain
VSNKLPLSDATRGEINAHVSRRLREARAGCNLTQQEIARRMGCTQAALSLWESSVRAPRVADLVELGIALSKPIAFFLDFEGSVNAPE